MRSARTMRDAQESREESDNRPTRASIKDESSFPPPRRVSAFRGVISIGKKKRSDTKSLLKFLRRRISLSFRPFFFLSPRQLLHLGTRLAIIGAAKSKICSFGSKSVVQCGHASATTRLPQGPRHAIRPGNNHLRERERGE